MKTIRLPEIHKIAMPDRYIVFIATQNTERLIAFEAALRNIGARVVGPQTLSFIRDNISLQAIQGALGELEEDESIYVVSAGSKGLELHGIAAPRTKVDITVAPRDASPLGRKR